MLNSEISALEDFDVPRFSANTTSRSLRAQDGLVLENVLANNPMDDVLLRIKDASSRDLSTQTEHIKTAFHYL